VNEPAELRTMHWSDIEAAVELEAELFPHDHWSREQFWSELAGVPATRCYVVAVLDDRVVGYAGVYAVSGADADVQTIAVARPAQRHRVGTQLLAAITAEARERGCSRVFLEVAADNTAAQEFYARHGFERVSTRRDYYGPGVAAIVMKYAL